MKMYKIAICDDDAIICEELESKIIEYSFDRTVSFEIQKWNDSVLFCNQIVEYNPDILFLDIEIPNFSGVEVAKFIRNEFNNENLIIFFISYKKNYAMELFQVHPHDFLVKPIETQKLNRALDKALKLLQLNSYFHYSYKKKNYVVPYSEVMYFYSQNKTVFIKKYDGETLSYLGKLKDIVLDLPLGFVCISKSYIINLRYLKSWKSGFCTMKDGMELSIAQSKRQNFKTVLLQLERG